ncbi:SDR family NAD(P)-dependent oxidoreductase [Silvimonas amylolytica]|uniref:Short-chain dehydrogenase n=1 Tax=Silvimonas amylolytica TaxID=449663 RepID=A0ABQ2PI65_9NEIS|nr:SDR family oxidoreductase [Silvimonas amylolytica]GGP25303.1 short-chain dehydrogenase [Silvimonas amylolytica]
MSIPKMSDAPRLAGKRAIIYAASGAIGKAIALAFASEGAKVFLTGRNLAKVRQVAEEIAAFGGDAQAAEVDALDSQAVEHHFSTVVTSAGRVDISFNAISIPQEGIQSIALAELSVDSFMRPLTHYFQSQFITTRSAARHMVIQKSGVILMHTPEPARLGAPLVGGMGPAWAAIEGLSRALSAEVAAHGVRAVCLRTTGIPETGTIELVFGLHAKAYGMTREQFQALMESRTHRQRSTTLQELAQVAAFVASDQAAAMTGTVVNLTGGAIVD